MVQTIDVDKTRTGWHALDVRGEKIGDVAEIGSNYALVVKGLFLPTDLYIPLLATEPARRGSVHFRSERAEGQGRGDRLAGPPS